MHACRDLATHIDGFIATTAHTLVVSSEQVTGQKADLLQAALTALEAAIRLVRPGSHSADFAPILQKVPALVLATIYSCRSMQQEHAATLCQGQQCAT